MSKLSKKERRKMRALKEQGLDVLVDVQPVQPTQNQPLEVIEMSNQTQNVQNQAQEVNQMNQTQQDVNQTQTNAAVEAPTAASTSTEAPSGFFDWKNQSGSVSSKWVGAGVGAVSAAAASVILAGADVVETLVSTAGGTAAGFGVGIATEAMLEDGYIQYGATAALAAAAGYGASLLTNSLVVTKEEVVTIPSPAPES